MRYSELNPETQNKFDQYLEMKKKMLAVEVRDHFDVRFKDSKHANYLICINLKDSKNNTLKSLVINPTKDGGGTKKDILILKEILNTYSCTAEMLLYLSKLSECIKNDAGMAIQLFEHPNLYLTYNVLKSVNR